MALGCLLVDGASRDDPHGPKVGLDRGGPPEKRSGERKQRTQPPDPMKRGQQRHQRSDGPSGPSAARR